MGYISFIFVYVIVFKNYKQKKNSEEIIRGYCIRMGEIKGNFGLKLL